MMSIFHENDSGDNKNHIDNLMMIMMVMIAMIMIMIIIMTMMMVMVIEKIWR